MEMVVRSEFLMKDIVKSSTNVKIPEGVNTELATIRKLALANSKTDSVIEITALKKDNVLTDDITVIGTVPAEILKSAETILKYLVEAVQGNGEPKGKAATKIKFIYAI
jgi:hypothetical protein